MKFLDDEFKSIGMLLADAHRDLRSGTQLTLEVKSEPLPSQLGALLYLSRHHDVTLGPSAWQKVSQICRDNPGICSIEWSQIESTDLEQWLDDAHHTQESLLRIGFWLSGFFLSSERRITTSELTKILTGRKIEAPEAREWTILRRYPTGGISEKQALILPALLHSISKDFSIASYFLIAGLLAHTGGTRAKLSVLPGFCAPEAMELPQINFASRPITYISANESVCPRDAILYRARGETGTVEDQALMVSSIMSKQIAVPADAVVIDVLFGKHSFLKTRREAEDFGEACTEISIEFGIKVKCLYRSDILFLPKSIGASAEVFEAYEILRGPYSEKFDFGQDTELGIAVEFVKELLSSVNVEPHLAEKTAFEKLRSGEAARSFIEIMGQHSVDSEWLSGLVDEPYLQLLGGMEHCSIYSDSQGILGIDYVALADAINSKINLDKYAGGFGFEVTPGGAILKMEHGQKVSCGDEVLEIFSETVLASDVVAAIRSAIWVE